MPDVFLGADAAAGLDGRRGFLYGEKRHRQVDILGFEPVPGGLHGNATLDALVEGRLELSEIRGWRIVGVAVRPADLRNGEEALLRGLVAGDIVIAVERASETHCSDTSPDRKHGLRILVHRGDCLADVRTTRPRSAAKRRTAG